MDSAAARRRRAAFGLLLAGLGVVVISGGLLARSVPEPETTEISAPGTTQVPRTWFFQHRWVLFADVPDPRRVPDADELGCHPAGDLAPPPKPQDMTQFGSRVIRGEPLAAVLLLGRSGSNAAIRCDATAVRYAPLHLATTSTAPPFTPTAIVISGFILLVMAGLVHPATVDLRLHRHARHPVREAPRSDESR